MSKEEEDSEYSEVQSSEKAQANNEYAPLYSNEVEFHQQLNELKELVDQQQEQSYI